MRLILKFNESCICGLIRSESSLKSLNYSQVKSKTLRGKMLSATVGLQMVKRLFGFEEEENCEECECDDCEEEE